MVFYRPPSKGGSFRLTAGPCPFKAKMWVQPPHGALPLGDYILKQFKIQVVVAQLVELSIVIRKVVGSTPICNPYHY